MSLILFLLLGFFLWWLIKGIFAVVQARNQFKSIFDQARRATGGQYAGQQPRERKGGWSNPLRRRKKIDPEVGEYVRFTESKSSTSQTTDPDKTAHIVHEEQVTDVEWEDIK
ncbi:MAG: hypothetical protein K2F82_05805 [Muribaculaceae bacterium]|nr:hypothetical protein [Muribaculaceae bacterium]MDE6316077.1 hypothetical protein [Muribaculaceae bacterium]